jgi:hypothetical protein
MKIEAHVDVRGYFREQLVEVLARQAVGVRESTEWYLVNLLGEQALITNPRLWDETFAELAAEAQEASGTEKLRLLRKLGDKSLYVCGFFSDHLERRGVTPSYAIAFGSQAYTSAHQLAQLGMSAVESGLAEVFHELAQKFERLIAVLDEVRESTALRTPQDIIRLYERWKKTRSPMLAKRLQQEGVFPQEAPHHGKPPATLH